MSTARNRLDPCAVGRRVLAFSLPLVFTAFVVGCGPKGPATSVSGKVTLEGKPVSGTIKFVGSDGKEVSGPLLEGAYKVDNPPKGECEILVLAPAGMGASPVAPPPGLKVDGGATLGGGSGPLYPPAKYAQPNNGIPKFNVTGGKQTHDIDLKP